MHKSQAEVGFNYEVPTDDRTPMERARDEMTSEDYDELIQRALNLVMNG